MARSAPEQHPSEPPARRTVALGVRSLPARISIFVLVATLVTSAFVTSTSVYSMDSFLRKKIDDKFPAILIAVGEKLELWYDQRALEIDVFANSSILSENLSRIARGADGPERVACEAEIEQYLSYVLEGFPQYDAVLVLDADGERLLTVGAPSPLASAESSRSASTKGPRFGDLLSDGDRPMQIAWAPVDAATGETVGSIHAVLRFEGLDEILRSEDIGSSGTIFVVDASGTHILGSAPGGVDESVLATDEHRVHDYTHAAGHRVIGSAHDFERFDWRIVVEERYDEAFAPSISAVHRVVGLNLVIVVVLGIAAFGVALTIARPIRALADAATAISEGQREVAIPALRNRDEVGLLARAFAEMLSRLTVSREEIERSHAEVEAANHELKQEKVELERANEVLEQLSITDGLTKLHNHRFFQDQLVRETKRADRSGDPLALILIDIDHFKRWNDRLGHASGDEILRKLAEVVSETIRETDLLARYGGEEFALLLAKTDLEGALALAEKVRERVARSEFLMMPSGEQESVTVSAGVSVYRGDRKEFFVDADEALYRAKNSGRDCVMGPQG